MEKLHILLADDHDLVRQGLRSLLEQNPMIGSVVEARNGHEAVLKNREHRPHVVLMDYEMPNFNGIYAIREIMREYPRQAIILLSAHQSREHIMEGVFAGVRGFLPKESRIGELINAIAAVADGGTWFKGAVAEMMAPTLIESVRKGRKAGLRQLNGQLTNREQEILRLFAEGLTPQQIAGRLSISKRTVDVHKSNIFKKLQFKNLSELIRYAVKKSIIKI